MQEFYTLFADYLTAVCSRYISSDDDLKDVFQDCFVVNIATHIDKFRIPRKGSLRAWATRIAVNQSLMFLQVEAHRKTAHSWTQTPQRIGSGRPHNQRHPARRAPPNDRELPDGYRTVFNLYVLEDKATKKSRPAEYRSLIGITTTQSEEHPR